MDQRVTNPWTWQQPIGFCHAVEANGTIYLSGQVSCDADGAPTHVGDLGAQTRAALDNVETVLRQAGYGLRNVVRLNVYTTDVDGYRRDGGPAVKDRLAAAGAHYASTLLGVERLAAPEFLIELEATAAAG